eukprot:749004-Hanusia_phi.AAC.1
MVRLQRGEVLLCFLLVSALSPSNEEKRQKQSERRLAEFLSTTSLRSDFKVCLLSLTISSSLHNSTSSTCCFHTSFSSSSNPATLSRNLSPGGFDQ